MSDYTPDEEAQFVEMAIGAQGQQLRDLTLMTAQIALEIKIAGESGDTDAMAHQGQHLAHIVFGMSITMLPSYALHLGDEINRRTAEGLDVYTGLRDHLPGLRTAMSDLVDYVDFRGLDAMARINDSILALEAVLANCAYSHLATSGEADD